MLLDNFEDARSAKAFQRLGRVVLFAKLGDIEGVTELSDGAFGKGEKVLSGTADPAERLHLEIIALLT
jgi:hypothetical protein